MSLIVRYVADAVREREVQGFEGKDRSKAIFVFESTASTFLLFPGGLRSHRYAKVGWESCQACFLCMLPRPVGWISSGTGRQETGLMTVDKACAIVLP